MNITVLDAGTLGDDLSLAPLSACGTVTVFPSSPQETLKDRLATCEVAVLNKVKITREVLADAPALRLICLTATGYDNVDLEACRERGVAVCNVRGYSTHSVAQVTLAMALSLSTHLPAYANYVSSGAYTEGGVANRLQPIYHELHGKTWGICGLGAIGRQVARTAQVMGCRVLACRRSPDEEFETVDMDTLCKNADILSLHLPLSAETKGFLSRERIARMKKSAIVINVARGAVADEEALAEAIENQALGGLGIDVYSTEPMPNTHPLWRIKNHPRVLLTPHMAWGAFEARARCVEIVAQNIRAFLQGEQLNRVD